MTSSSILVDSSGTNGGGGGKGGGGSVGLLLQGRQVPQVSKRLEETNNSFTHGKVLPTPILAPFGRRSFFGTERLDTPSSEAIPSSRRPRKSSPYMSANPPMTKGLSSPSASSPKSASSSITPPSLVYLSSDELANAGGIIEWGSHSPGTHCPTSSLVRTTYRRT